MSDQNGSVSTVAVVTGAASGIGRATAERLARDGVRVALLDRDAELLEETASALEGSLPIVLDLRRPDEVGRAFDQVEREFGGFDKVAHVAGVAAQQHIKRRFAEMLESGAAVAPAGFDFTAELSDSDWYDIIDLNLNATFYVVRRALQSMIPRRAGAIVTVSSMAADMPSPGHVHYSAARAGVKC